jgi:hypothetical protein
MSDRGHTEEIITENAYQRYLQRTPAQRMDDLETRVALLEKQCVRYSDADGVHRHLVGRE